MRGVKEGQKGGTESTPEDRGVGRSGREERGAREVAGSRSWICIQTSSGFHSDRTRVFAPL